MIEQIGIIIGSLIVILAGCQFFTNGVEWLGHKLHLSEGATGSVLAAVGTAMPETLIPILALIFGSTREIGEAIGIGAILGAPFMLSTLAMFVGGVSIVVCHARRRREKVLVLDNRTIELDFKFFILVYVLAFVAGLIHIRLIKFGIAALLVASYIYYLKIIFSHGGGGSVEPAPLYLIRPTKLSTPDLPHVVAQVLISLSLIVAGGRLFVYAVEHLSLSWGVSAAVLSFLIAPVATELPEKANSIIWYSRGRDTLAMGNVTGAMVFQSSIIVALGITMTSWALNPFQLSSVVIALASSAMFLAYLKLRKALHAHLMILGGLFYLAYVIYFLAFR